MLYAKPLVNAYTLIHPKEYKLMNGLWVVQRAKVYNVRYAAAPPLLTEIHVSQYYLVPSIQRRPSSYYYTQTIKPSREHDKPRGPTCRARPADHHTCSNLCTRGFETHFQTTFLPASTSTARLHRYGIRVREASGPPIRRGPSPQLRRQAEMYPLRWSYASSILQGSRRARLQVARRLV